MWKLAVIEVDGRTLTLRTPEAAEDAFLKGQLTELTRVYMRDETGSLTPKPLQEIEQFCVLLGIPLASVPITQPSADTDPTAEDEPQMAVPVAEDHKAKSSTESPSKDQASPPTSSDVGAADPNVAPAAGETSVGPQAREGLEDSVVSAQAGNIKAEGSKANRPSAVEADTIDVSAIRSVRGSAEEHHAAHLANGSFSGTDNRNVPEYVEIQNIGNVAWNNISPAASEKKRWLSLALGAAALLAIGSVIFIWRSFFVAQPEMAEVSGSTIEPFTAYASLDVPVYAAADENSGTGDRLLYGQAALLRPVVDNRLWLIIEEGPLTGRYVPAGLLSSSRPLGLDRSNAGILNFEAPTAIHSNANPTASILQYVNAGESMFSLGTAIGSDGGQWALVELGSGAAMRPGFVPISSLVTTRTDSEEAQTVPDPRMVIEGPIQRSTARCATIPAGLDRLICQSPALAETENAMRIAYSEAAQRFSDAKQPMPPYAQYRTRVAECRTVACAHSSMISQIEALNGLNPPRPQPVAIDRSQAVSPRNEPSDWIRPRDYPDNAIEERREGTVGFMLQVDPRGRVSGCSITRSSGHNDLDSATCRAVTRRARFNSARDESGRPINSQYSSTVTWRLP